ncbi:primosomal protein N' [Halalkalibacterium halodurans]|uniref:primosomal protein N' n=1 Tax=Halalkalibacterium halodurans TaxID=86665 RepID=UPI002E22DB32|nr:primosomal protein N' [Halalkalibacterium halodurans]MED4124501.1 primosomal protein N' [Halalkalibacterium halodurans]
MIVEVVVDVPTMQTDRRYDYLVPERLESIIESGLRVVVPFGPRKVQGFVLAVKHESSVKKGKLKELADVLDGKPVLTQELLELGEWLTDETLCFQVSAYQAMLPAAMRTKVIKQLRLLTEVDKLPSAIRPYFQTQDAITWETLANERKEVLQHVKSALNEQLLEWTYVVEDKGRKKTERITVQLSHVNKDEGLEQIPKRAKKQRDMWLFLAEQGGRYPSLSLIEALETTRATLKGLMDKGLVKEIEEEVYRDPFLEKDVERTEPLPLTIAQQNVATPIARSIEENRHEPFLLHGVTGSGKTEIYLQAINRVLAKGKQAIVLVPEISLTPQMVHRFRSRFGSKVAVMHSGLSVGEKYDEWRKIHRREVQVVVGARSAIFAPFENLGIIIIDEEHESTYKQEEAPRYHARDVAMFRGRYHRCPVILGSATPALESYARAKKGVYTLLSLTERVNDRPMPTVEVVDMREELRGGNRSMFSEALFSKLKQRIERGEQSVLFLNRRGYSTFVMCRDCGYVATCEHCDISLTYHRSNHSLKCHYCGHEEPMPKVCKSCGSEHIRFFGSGTQKVEEELTKVLPEARVIRMDVDTTRKKGAHEQLLKQFGQGEADILLGTQMIAKGLDFPNITLVGILAADAMLHLPDFRATERTFQLLSQVSGRAGRHTLPGEVVVQTYSPDHYSIELVKQHDYLSYFETEMMYRRQGGYPPYYYLTLIHISHSQITKVIDVSEKIVRFLREQLDDRAIVLGPVVSPIARINDRYRYQCLIKYKNEPELSRILREIRQHFLQETSRGELQVNIDRQPYLFM